MANIVLDCANPEQVDSPTQIDADLGIGGRRLIVASGTALPQLRHDGDDVGRATYSVRLGIDATDIEQATTTAGLAAFWNDDTNYLFAVDKATTTIEDGSLTVVVDLAVSGSPSGLVRFSYQTVAVIRRTTSEIAGTVTWDAHNYTPSSPTAAAVGDMLRPLANRVTVQPSSGFGIDETLTPVTPGEIISVHMSDDHTYVATYRIANPPKLTALQVTIDCEVPGQNGVLSFSPVPSGSDRITLSASDPDHHVDFVGTFIMSPR